jgi:hypothetical protein
MLARHSCAALATHTNLGGLLVVHFDAELVIFPKVELHDGRGVRASPAVPTHERATWHAPQSLTVIQSVSFVEIGQSHFEVMNAPNSFTLPGEFPMSFFTVCILQSLREAVKKTHSVDGDSSRSNLGLQNLQEKVSKLQHVTFANFCNVIRGLVGVMLEVCLRSCPRASQQ